MLVLIVRAVVLCGGARVRPRASPQGHLVPDRPAADHHGAHRPFFIKGTTTSETESTLKIILTAAGLAAGQTNNRQGGRDRHARSDDDHRRRGGETLERLREWWEQ
jgi:hypothetical protein